MSQAEWKNLPREERGILKCSWTFAFSIASHIAPPNPHIYSEGVRQGLPALPGILLLHMIVVLHQAGQ